MYQVWVYGTCQLHNVAFGLTMGIVSLIWMLVEWGSHVPSVSNRITHKQQ